MNNIKLKPCPFCGGAAKLVQIRGENHNYWADGLFYIEVDHKVNVEYVCPLYAHAFGHYGGGYNKRTQQYAEVTEKAKEACEKWNRRAYDEQRDAD